MAGIIILLAVSVAIVIVLRPSSVTPVGVSYRTCSDTQLGIAFDYPSNWGDCRVASLTEYDGKEIFYPPSGELERFTGARFQIVFGNATGIEVVGVTHDYFAPPTFGYKLNKMDLEELCRTRELSRTEGNVTFNTLLGCTDTSIDKPGVIFADATDPDVLAMAYTIVFRLYRSSGRFAFFSVKVPVSTDTQTVPYSGEMIQTEIERIRKRQLPKETLANIDGAFKVFSSFKTVTQSAPPKTADAGDVIFTGMTLLSTSGWKTYRDTRFSLKYPKEFSIEGAAGRITLAHVMKLADPLSSHPCDERGGGPPISDYEDAKINVRVIDRPLPEAVEISEYDGPRFVQENMESGTFKLTREYIKKYQAGELDGFRLQFSVEGCGQIVYYFPLATNQTLRMERSYTTSFAYSLEEEFMTKVASRPDFINEDELESIVYTIVWTLK